MFEQALGGLLQGSSPAVAGSGVTARSWRPCPLIEALLADRNIAQPRARVEAVNLNKLHAPDRSRIQLPSLHISTSEELKSLNSIANLEIVLVDL